MENNSVSIVVSWKSQYDAQTKSATYRQVFSSPIILDSLNYEIALISLETFYSFPNIEAGVNNVFAYKTAPANPSQLIYIPTGNYEISALATEISNQVTPAVYNNMILSRNTATLKSVFQITGTYAIDFTVPNSLNSLLGFNNEIVGGAPGYYSGENIVNILNVNSILVNCDLINNSYNNGALSSVIYSFFPNVSPGFKIVRNVESPVYIQVNKTQLNNLTTWLTDQDGNLINFRGEVVTIRFHLRKIK